MKVRKIRGQRLPSRLASVAIVAILGGGMAGSVQAADLYFTFNKNLNHPNASVFLFGAPGQQAIVSNLAGFSETVTLSAEGFENVFIPSNFQQSGTGILDTGFRVQSVQPIAGYFINRAPATTDMTYLLEEDALGNNYVIANQGAGFGEGSQVAVHAIQDATSITFTPVGGAPIAVGLNAGETYKYAGGGTDLTGSFISANRPVAVFAGHECAQVPPGRVACDTLLEQMIPTDKLSTAYLVTASHPAGEPGVGNDLVRVIATVGNTTVQVDGANVATLASGEFYEFSLDGGSGAQIGASQPVMVAQYLIGTGGSGVLTDPALSLVPGSDTWLDEYRLATPSGAQAFSLNWASLVVRTADLASLRLDGVAVDTSGFSAIAGTPFSRGIIDLPVGLFDLMADSAFLVMLGGGDSADSYFTHGGATFSPGISPPPPPPPPTPVAVPVGGPAGLVVLVLGMVAVAGHRLRRSRRFKG